MTPWTRCYDASYLASIFSHAVILLRMELVSSIDDLVSHLLIYMIFGILTTGAHEC